MLPAAVVGVGDAVGVAGLAVLAAAERVRGVGHAHHGLAGDGDAVVGAAADGRPRRPRDAALVVAGAAVAVAVHARDDGARALVAVEGVGLKVAVAVAAVQRVGQLVLGAVLVLV